MNLCEQLNEELDKSKIKALVKSFIEAFKSFNDDGFEILEVDGHYVVDSDGELEDETGVSIESIGPVEDFKEILDEWSEEDYEVKLDDKDIQAVIKGLEGMVISRSAEVDNVYREESKGKTVEDFDITLQKFKYDSKKDILSVIKFKE